MKMVTEKNRKEERTNIMTKTNIVKVSGWREFIISPSKSIYIPKTITITYGGKEVLLCGEVSELTAARLVADVAEYATGPEPT
jgi:hypothetical protein